MFATIMIPQPNLIGKILFNKSMSSFIINDYTTPYPSGAQESTSSNDDTSKQVSTCNTVARTESTRRVKDRVVCMVGRMARTFDGYVDQESPCLVGF